MCRSKTNWLRTDDGEYHDLVGSFNPDGFKFTDRIDANFENEELEISSNSENDEIAQPSVLTRTYAPSGLRSSCSAKRRYTRTLVLS